MISKQNIFYIISALAAFLFILIYSFSPLESDDYWFLEGTQGMQNGWKMFVVACETMKERWLTDTGRLGNIINPVFLALLPKWIFNIVSGLFIWVSIIFACRLATASPGSLRSYLLFSAIIFFYPWYDYLFCITFGINYVWGISLAVMASFYLLDDRDRKLLSLMSISLLCFAAGWFHEGFGVPLACGGVSVAICRYKRHELSSEFLIKLGSLIAGSLMICLSPVFWHRAENAISNIYKFPLREMIMQIGPGVSVFLAYALFLIYLVCRQGCRQKLKQSSEGIEKICFITVVLIVSLAVMIKYYNGPRTGAGVVMFGSIGIILLGGFSGFKLSKKCAFMISLLLTTAVMINLISAVVAQKKLLKEYSEVVERFTSSSLGEIYYNLTYPKADLTLFKTTVRQFHERIPKLQLASYLDKNKEMVILPESLEGMTATDKECASRKGFFIYKGYIVMDPTAELEGPQLLVSTTRNDNVPTRYRTDVFHDKDGKEWVFIMPHIQTLDEDLRITDVK